MLRTIIPLLLVVISLVNVDAQGRLPQADVVVSASIERVGANLAELIVTAEIADGLHIYGQGQPKPFLATEISIADASKRIAGISEFVPDRQPLTIVHEQLGTELQEYEGVITWRADVELVNPAEPITITGSFFAQACEAQRCFAPQTYPFNAHLDTDQTSAATVGGETDTEEHQPTDSPSSSFMGLAKDTNDRKLSSLGGDSANSDAVIKPTEDFSLAGFPLSGLRMPNMVSATSERPAPIRP